MDPLFFLNWSEAMADQIFPTHARQADRFPLDFSRVHDSAHSNGRSQVDERAALQSLER